MARRTEMGIKKLSLNQFYKHSHTQRNIKVFRPKQVGKRTFDLMQKNLINTSNNKLHSDVLGHLGSGYIGLSGSPPRQMSSIETNDHRRRNILGFLGKRNPSLDTEDISNVIS